MKRRTHAVGTGLSLRFFLSLVLLLVLYAPLLLLSAYVLVGIFGGPSVDVLAVALVLLSLPFIPYFAERATFAYSGAREISRRDYPELYTLVERVCALGDLPLPRLAIVESAVPNAFSFGRTRKRSVLVVTDELLARLDVAELEAVIAHELMHVASRDALVMTLLGLPTLAFRPLFALPLKLANRGKWGEPVLLLMPFIFFVPLLVSLWIASALTTLFVMSVSRQREYVADRGAAIVTGAPEALMSALQKIAGALPLIPARDLRQFARMNGFSVVPTEGGDAGVDPAAIFPSHPPLAKRLARLSADARAMGRPLTSEPQKEPLLRASPAREPNRAAAYAAAVGAAHWIVNFVPTGVSSTNPTTLTVSFWIASSFLLLSLPIAVFLGIQGIGRAQRGARGMIWASVGASTAFAPFALGMLSFYAYNVWVTLSG